MSLDAEPAAADPVEDRLPKAGDVLGDYTLTERLGRGSMGEVWRAAGPTGAVAVKIPLRPAFLRHLRQEGLLLAHVDHPNVARVLHTELDVERPFLVTELVEGQPLRALCRGTLTPQSITLIGDQILAGLEAIHAAGVLHLDLKPENVIVPAADADALEEVGKVKIVDLGLGRATTRLMEEVYLSASLASRVPAVAGTLAYMSPEQRKGRDLDPRADLFAFGIVLHEMLTGRLPEPGTPVTALRPELPPRWDVLVSRLTHPDRARRPDDARATRHLVAFTLVDKLPVSAPRGGLEPRDLLSLDEESFAQASPYAPGMVIGDGYELEALLGRGGCGEVWRAVRADQRYALKLILGPEAQVGLEREVEVAQRITQPGIPNVVGDHSRDEPPHVVFDLVSGRSLRLLIHDDELLALPRALTIFAGMLRLVDACHAAGVVHMDLKPEHFLVEEGETGAKVSLIDFGLAALVPRERVTGSLASQVEARGTLDYMAPEQREGRVTAAVDVYALGLCLFELLTLHLPKGPQRLRTLRRDVPRALDRLVHAMLQTRPGDRPTVAQARGVILTALEKSQHRRSAVAQALTVGLLSRVARLWREIPLRVRGLLIVPLATLAVLAVLLLPEYHWQRQIAAFPPAAVQGLGALDFPDDARTWAARVPRTTGRVLVLDARIEGHLLGGQTRQAHVDRRFAEVPAARRARDPGDVDILVSVRRLGRGGEVAVYDVRNGRTLARYRVAAWPTLGLAELGDDDDVAGLVRRLTR